MNKKFTAKTNLNSYSEKYRQQKELAQRNHSRNHSRNNKNGNSTLFNKKPELTSLNNLIYTFGMTSNKERKQKTYIPKPNHNRSSSLPNHPAKKSHSVANLTATSKMNNNKFINNNPKLQFSSINSNNSRNSNQSLKSLNFSSTDNNFISSFSIQQSGFLPSLSLNLCLKGTFFEIPLNSFTINKKEMIYYSEFTEIYKGKYINLPVAVKIIPNIDSMSDKDLNYLKNEIEISISLNHPYIVRSYGISYDDKKKQVFIISEFCSNLSLKQYIENKKKEGLDFKLKIKFCYQISLAILYMHSRNPQILHRDLKSGNVFLDENLNIKLGDFGMAKILNKNMNNYQTNSQSTPFFMAPEFMSKGIFTEKSDIYSLGILFWEIFMENTKPFENENVFDFITGNENILNKRPSIALDKICNNQQILFLIQNCWDIEPDKRPFIEEVVTILENMLEKL